MHQRTRLPNHSSTFVRHAVAGLCLASLVGCAADGGSEGARRGAAAGAVVGLTLGALTGDASLAAAGAVAGAATGGAAGYMQDYDNDRRDYRAETMAAAIGSKNSGGDGEAPASWQDIDAFIGRWQVTMWGLDQNGSRIDATAEAKSALDNTSSVTFSFSNFASKQVTGEITGTTRLSFDKAKGFEMLNQFSSTPEGNRWVGHYDNQSAKYIFFYAGSSQETFSGVQRSDYRLQMQMVGSDVIVLETWATVGTEEKRIQSYRLTRTS